MHFQAVPVTDGADALYLGDVPYTSAAAIGAVLNIHQSGAGQVGGLRVVHRCFHLLRREPSSISGHELHTASAVGHGATTFIPVDMRSFLADHFIPGPG